MKWSIIKHYFVIQEMVNLSANMASPRPVFMKTLVEEHLVMGLQPKYRSSWDTLSWKEWRQIAFIRRIIQHEKSQVNGFLQNTINASRLFEAENILTDFPVPEGPLDSPLGPSFTTAGGKENNENDDGTTDNVVAVKLNDSFSASQAKQQL